MHGVGEHQRPEALLPSCHQGRAVEDVGRKGVGHADVLWVFPIGFHLHSNIIIAEDGTPYILDWSHATQGNASADAARTYLLFCLAGDEETARKYLALFCRKSDTAMQYVQKWMPIVAASQSVKGNANEREFLLRWVNVVDYQ